MVPERTSRGILAQRYGDFYVHFPGRGRPRLGWRVWQDRAGIACRVMGRAHLDDTVTLSSKQTRHLRSLAHHLKPVVQIGGRGISVALIGATDDALEAHELIKVKLGDIEDRSEVRAAATTLSEETGSDVVQVIGKTIVLFRQREKESAYRLP